MFKSILIAALIFTINVNAQVSVSVDSLFFPQMFTGSIDSFSVYVRNLSNQQSEVKINNIKTVFGTSDTLISISPNDSSIVWIKYHPNQNVIDKDLIFITSDDSLIGSIIKLSGSGKFGDSYDASTFNKYDSELKTALTALVNNHTSLGYNLARDKMFMEFDNQK